MTQGSSGQVAARQALLELAVLDRGAGGDPSGQSGRKQQPTIRSTSALGAIQDAITSSPSPEARRACLEGSGAPDQGAGGAQWGVSRGRCTPPTMTHVNGSDTAANRRAVDPLGKGERRSEKVGGRGIGYVHAGVERPTTNAVFAKHSHPRAPRVSGIRKRARSTTLGRRPRRTQQRRRLPPKPVVG